MILPGLLTLTGFPVVPDKLRESNLNALRVSVNVFGGHDNAWNFLIVEICNQFKMKLLQDMLYLLKVLWHF